MESSSNANAALTEATKKRKKMIAHNATCRRSRLRIKDQVIQMREENKKMKKELVEKESQAQRREEEIQEYKRAVEEQMAQMRQFPTSLEIEGQSFSTSEQMSEYLLSRTYEPHHQGVLDSGAGSFLENYDDWIEELLQPDAAAGISHTENLVVENQNNELVNQIDHNAMVQRREISPAQRSAENERDRQDMPGHNMELERLRKVEAKYKEVVPLLNTMSQLAEESKQMNDTEPYLARRIQEVDNIRQHIQEMHNKSFDHGSESSHTVMYTAELVQDFIEKLDVKEKSKVDFPDFEGLEEELEKSGSRSLPHSLVPIDMILKKHYGDITAESNQSTPLIRASYILFCSVIKEMDQLQLEQLDLDKMILWRDAINSGLSIGFKASFAIEHLKNIACAYFGSKERESMKERMLKLKTDLRIAEMQSSEMCSNGPHDFQGKPVSTGLWRAQSIL